MDVETPPSELVPVLWILVIALFVASVFSLVVGFSSGTSLVSTLELAAGGIGIALSLVASLGILALEKLASIEAHIRALVKRQ